MSFDGVACREGEGAGVCIRTPGGRTLNYSYKLAFDCTNNEAEYEAMVLAIRNVFTCISYVLYPDVYSRNFL